MNELVERRLDRLEHTNRRLRWGAAGLGLALAVGALASWRAPGPEVLEVRGLRVVDEAGRARATLIVDGDEAGLTLLDEQGTERARFFATDLESILRFKNRAGTDRVVLTTGHDDQGLYLLDREGGDRVSLVSTEADQGLYFPGDEGLFLVERGEGKKLLLRTTP